MANFEVYKVEGLMEGDTQGEHTEHSGVGVDEGITWNVPD